VLRAQGLLSLSGIFFEVSSTAMSVYVNESECRGSGTSCPGTCVS
jgi:hypothetical protein